MEAIISDFLIKTGRFAWIGVGLLALIWVAKEPLSALLKTRQIRQRDREILLALLKEKGVLSDTSRSVLLEGLERDEFARFTGLSLRPTERALLAALIKENESEVRWSDLKRVQPHMKLCKSGVLSLELSLWQWAAYWSSRLFSTLLLLVAVSCLLMGGYTALFDGMQNSGLFWTGVLYLLMSIYARVAWVLPHDSYRKLKPLFPLGCKPEASNDQLQSTALVHEISDGSSRPLEGVGSVRDLDVAPGDVENL